MTVQRKHLIDLPDLVAFNFKCNHCGVSLSVPCATLPKAGRLEKCPSCEHVWNNQAMGTINAFNRLQESLVALGLATGGDFKGFHLSIEVACDEIP
jgi:predicted Zn finger-like uncharacterized protein